MEIGDIQDYLAIAASVVTILGPLGYIFKKPIKMFFLSLFGDPSLFPHLQGEIGGSVNFNGRELYQVLLTFEPGDHPVIFRRIECSGKIWLPDRPYLSYVAPLTWGQPYQKPSYYPAKEVGYQLVDNIPVIPKKEPKSRLLFVDPGDSHAIKITVKQGTWPFSKKICWEGAV